MATTYDSRCYDLAEIFLEDEEWADKGTVQRLALEIQQCIEDFIENERPTPNAA